MPHPSLVEETGAAEPEPVEVVEGVVGVQELGLEVKRTLLPTLEKILITL